MWTVTNVGEEKIRRKLSEMIFEAKITELNVINFGKCPYGSWLSNQNVKVKPTYFLKKIRSRKTKYIYFFQCNHAKGFSRNEFQEMAFILENLSILLLLLLMKLGSQSSIQLYISIVSPCN